MMKFWLLKMWNRKLNLAFAIKFAVVIFCFILIASCAKTDDEIGLNTSGGSLNSFQVDTFTIKTKSILTEVDRSNNASVVFLGSYNSSTTGISSNRIFTSVAPVDLTYRFPAGIITPVSLKFHLRSLSTYGVIASQNFKVNQLTEAVVKGESYTYRDSLKIASTVAGTFNLNSAYTGNITVDLDLSLGQKIVDFGNVAFTTTETFVDLFKGLAITPETTPGVDEGMTYEIDADSIYLELIVKDESNQLDTILFKTPSSSRSFYQTQYNPSTSQAATSYNNSNYTNEFLFVQGLGGISSEISFPTLNNWYKSNKVLINSAVLTFTVESGSDALYSTPSNLIVHNVNKGSNDGIQSGGKSNNTYTMDIQSLLSEFLVANEPCTFNLSVINSHIHPEMVKLFGPNHSTTPLKLVIDYTEY